MPRPLQTDAIGEIGIPFFLLLGFSVENGKAYLEKQGVEGNWKHSHDLANLYQKAASGGFAPPSGVDTFITSLSQYHKEFWFRYPEKAGIADVFKAASSIDAVQTLLEEVADHIGAQDIFSDAATRGVKP